MLNRLVQLASRNGIERKLVGNEFRKEYGAGSWLLFGPKSIFFNSFDKVAVACSCFLKNINLKTV